MGLRTTRGGWTRTTTTAIAMALGWGGALAGQQREAAEALPAEAAAADAPLPLARLSGPITLDGRPDEAAWLDVAPLPLTMYLPVFRGEPRERTEIRVAYDDEALWFAGRFFDSDPDGIRVNSLYRDRWNGDDAFAIYVDAFNDNQNAKWFGTTPAGVRFDQLVSDDGATLNGSWDAFWDARTTLTDEGWFVEVRIPFSTLGFQVGDDGRAVMGLTVTRLISRLNERVTFPAIDPVAEFRRPSVARDVVMEGVRSRTPLYATPYALAGTGRSEALDPATSAYRTSRDESREVGLDVRWNPTGNLAVDLTLNTDFAQVEADDQQVNLDRFPLFFPEKRRFFQEGSGLFEFRTAGGGQLFHSRRIGLTEGREPVPVLAGARVVGRVGEWDVGLLDMHTRELPGVPRETFAVGRLRRRVLNAFSTLGFMATGRFADGREDLALGVDGSFRLFGDHYFSGRWAGTRDEADPAGLDLLERSLWSARWERRVGRGLAYSVEGVRAARGFDPGLGFQPRRDFTTANVLANWYLFTDDHPVFRRVWPGMLAFSTFRNGDGALESGQYAVWVQWETKAGGGGWLEPKVFHENVLEPFSLDRDVIVPAGAYTYADLQLALVMPTGRRLRTSLDARAGTFFDGTRWQAIVGPTWNASPHLELGADYQITRLRFGDRGQGTDIHLGRLRVRSALDARASGNAFVQYNSVSDRLDLNVRLRYNFAEGTDLWLVYNEGLATDRLADPTAPRQPHSLARSFIVKYTHTFGF